MEISCPICGAEIKKDYKFCLSCGYNLQTAENADDKTVKDQLDKSKSTPAATQPQPTEPISTEPPPQQPTSQQSYQQQTYPPKVSKPIPKNIIGLLIAIIVIVVVVVVVLMLLGGAGGPLVGEWQADSYGFTYGIKLNGDHSLEMSAAGSPYLNVGQWEEKNGQICLTMSSAFYGSDVLGGSQCYDYEISQDGGTMTWSVSGISAMTLTKK